MSDYEQNYYIADLIYRSVTDSLSASEEAALNTWLKNDENRQLYDRILSEKIFAEKRRIYAELNVDDAYERFLKKLNHQEDLVEVKNHRSITSLLKYAAILIAVLATAYLTFFNEGNNHAIIDRDVEVVNTLQPGFEKATLVLSDGTEVNLEKNRDQFILNNKVVQVQNTDNMLVYKNNEEPDESPLVPLYHTLYVPKGGIYKLELPDGSLVWLNSSSSLKFPETFSGSRRIVELKGEAYFDIKKDAAKPFVVKTSVKDITVLGTEFNVSNYSDDNFFATTLVEGKVKLNSEGQPESQTVYMNPGERAVQMRNGRTMQVSDVDTERYTAWKDGKFYFEKENLENILTKAGRWYDFKFSFTDPELKERLFTGVVRKDYPLERLLGMIAKASKINYQINYYKSNQAYEVLISEN
ncbi:FecR family protein [Robertkochia solimangrovi]|uniref:FecR family protein n=1 Tax=Robertkochia solimangrovi TaxID=2213046 RepID=UPI00117C201E|nr:FecR domain-containing protein [Robertkochia solimangrovi]TRZ43505.1 hypothetical protein DMZ48_08745 [Robertkochia solimangrovi]